MAVTKADLKKLMSKGLTGQEAARLILQDSWEVDHSRQGFLSQADIQRLKSGLSRPEDIRDYNKYVHVYQLVDYTLKDAQIHALEAENKLLLACRFLEVYWLEDEIRRLQFITPAIVTQKQYDELKAKQREHKLRTLHTLYNVINCRADHVAPPEIAAKAETEDSIQELASFLMEQEPELYKETVRQIIQLIRDGKLKPVRLDEPTIASLKALYAEQDEQRANEAKEAEEATPGETIEVWDSFTKREDELVRASFDRARSQQTEQDIAELLRLLEWYLQTDDLPEAEAMSAEEQSRLINYTYCLEQELFEAGLPEWIKWVDEYMPNLDTETAARRIGMMQSLYVAILQEPASGALDERGWYKESKLWEKLSGYERLDSRQDRLGISNGAMLQIIAQQASEQIKIFLAIQASIEAVSETVGVKFTEDLEKWYEDIQAQVAIYNSLLEPKSEYHKPPHYLGMPKLEALKIGRLKPTARSLRYYRERMALALGDDWIKEALNVLDFRPSEPGSLAERMVEDIKIGRKMAGLEADEEESDGQAN